jgi:hypothetical protein
LLSEDVAEAVGRVFAIRMCEIIATRESFLAVISAISRWICTNPLNGMAASPIENGKRLQFEIQ